MLELALNAEMAVKLIKLKKQAQIELGKKFSISDEAGIEHLLLSVSAFKHRHSKARIYAFEILEGIEQVDIKGRHTQFIMDCRIQAGLIKAASHAPKRLYRGQSVLLDENTKSNVAEKVIYYRGQKTLVV